SRQQPDVRDPSIGSHHLHAKVSAVSLTMERSIDVPVFNPRTGCDTSNALKFTLLWGMSVTGKYEDYVPIKCR
ncbi:MAG: hypothetical protein MUO67_23715, partial [Anaerolineales bacterium]|nr:hypothetical protein [Anaerolineales bacterium]